MKTPVIYVDHWSPMRILEDNVINISLENLWNKIENNTKWIIFISAHNISNYTYISNIENIQIDYDFYGFPQQLYNQKYDIKWDMDLSKRLSKTIKNSILNKDIKMDHGVWSILKKLFPKANKKMSMITIDMNLSSRDYFLIWSKFKTYREEWYLIITSWSILHNFELMDNSSKKTQDWARDFNDDFLNKLKNKDFEYIINYQNLKNINLAFKTKEHYVPIIYAIWAVWEYEKVRVLSSDITNGSLSNNLIVFWEY